MSAAFVLNVVGVFIAGSSVQLLIFLIKRRAELRSLDTQSDSVALTSANAYIVTLQAGGEASLRRISVLETDLFKLQQAWNADRGLSSDSLHAAEREVVRLGAELARLKVDLAVTRSQVAELEKRLLPS